MKVGIQINNLFIHLYEVNPIKLTVNQCLGRTQTSVYTAFNIEAIRGISLI